MNLFDNLIIIPAKKSEFVIRKIHELLCSMGASLSIGDLYHLNDYNEKEVEPKVIEEQSKVIQELVDWPTAGWLTYDIEGGDLLVSYIVTSEYLVHVITISEQRADAKIYDIELINQIIFNISDLLSAQYIIRGESILNNDNKAIRIISNV